MLPVNQFYSLPALVHDSHFLEPILHFHTLLESVNMQVLLAEQKVSRSRHPGSTCTCKPIPRILHAFPLLRIIRFAAFFPVLCSTISLCNAGLYCSLCSSAALAPVPSITFRSCTGDHGSANATTGIVLSNEILLTSHCPAVHHHSHMSGRPRRSPCGGGKHSAHIKIREQILAYPCLRDSGPER